MSQSTTMFHNRCLRKELMDDLLCEGAVVEQTLKELDVINKFLGGNKITVDALKKVLQTFNKGEVIHPLKIADLGCGSGELLKLISEIAYKKQLPVSLIGVDANPFIIQYAMRNTSSYNNIVCIKDDVLMENFLSQSFDIINCTLFCHHLDSDQLVNFLRRLHRNTSTAIIINDIHRHWIAYYSIKWLTLLFSSSAMVKYDAKLSVLKAFTKQELIDILTLAGITNYTINWRWAFRYEIIIDCRKK